MQIAGESARWLKGKKCLVIGANGFLGTNLCRALDAQGAVVVGSGRSADPRVELTDVVKWVQADMAEPHTLLAAVKGADFVFPLVSTVLPASSNLDPVRDVKDNLIGMLWLLEHCAMEDVSKLVFVSSGGTVYGGKAEVPLDEDVLCQPSCSYGAVKLAVEHYLALYKRLHSLDYTVLRVANPYGPYQLPRAQGLIANALAKALTDTPLEVWGDGSVIRDYVHVDDVVRAILLATAPRKTAAPATFNIGSGVGRSVLEVINAIEVCLGKPMKVLFKKNRPIDVPANVLDVSRALKYLGWSPRVDWAEGLRSTAFWLEDRLFSGDAVVREPLQASIKDCSSSAPLLAEPCSLGEDV